MIKIATFNANSVRARLPIVLDWLEQEKPDVLALQETKVRDEEFPREAFESKGWNVVFKGQKSYNGVAFVSKRPMTAVETRLVDDGEEARFLAAEYEGVRLINTYVPQGYLIDSDKFVKKLKFLNDMKSYFMKRLARDVPALWMGDLNVAPSEIDLANPQKNLNHVCFHVDARKGLEGAMGDLWIDLFRTKEKGPGHYTFWDYFAASFEKNLGWRIDHILGTEPMLRRMESIRIDKEPRKRDKPSDHTFLVAQFNLP